MAVQLKVYGPYTTAERDALNDGFVPLYTIILNSTTAQFEFWDGSGWQATPSDNPTFENVIVTGVLAVTGNISTSGALQTMNGGDLASANDLTFPEANFFSITGTTQINRIASAIATDVTLRFAGSLTVKHNQAGGGGFNPIRLAGGVDFVTATDDVLVLMQDGSIPVWREKGRTLA